MTQAGAPNLDKLQKGALVLGTDLEIGALESVEHATDSGDAKLIVRHGFANDLLAIPASAIKEAEATRIQLNITREDAERIVYEGGDAGLTNPSPDNHKVIGVTESEMPDGPSTG